MNLFVVIIYLLTGAVLFFVLLYLEYRLMLKNKLYECSLLYKNSSKYYEYIESAIKDHNKDFIYHIKKEPYEFILMFSITFSPLMIPVYFVTIIYKFFDERNKINIKHKKANANRLWKWYFVDEKKYIQKMIQKEKEKYPERFI